MKIDDLTRIPMDFLKPYTSPLLSLFRFMTGLLFLQHGTIKYLNIPVGPMNNASPATMSGAAGIIELVAGVLLVLGLFTRPAAFIASGMCAVAYFYAHAGRGFYPILNGGELALHLRPPLPRCRRRRSFQPRPHPAQGGLTGRALALGA
jgi:putative oxidoreductase